jgi:hypothetical protein
MTPLEIFMARWQAAIPESVIKYIEVVNMQADINDAPDWGTAMVESESSPDVTLGSQPWVEEIGTFLIGLFTRSGQGPKALDTAVAYVRAAFHGYRSDGLLIEQVDGPHNGDPEGFGEWWQVGMTARYKFQTRRDASGPGYGNWPNFPDTPPAPLPGP